MADEQQITEHNIDETPLAVALSDYMMAVCRRRPTPSEMWDIYWAAIDAIERATRDDMKKKRSDGP